MPRPGVSGAISAADSEPTTARLSARCMTRNDTRIAQLAVTCSRTTPFGRCAASTRCSPRDRPRAAMSAITRTEVGEPLDHGLEFVDHDDEPRQLDVVVERADVAGARLGQHALAMAQLGTQAQHGALGLAFIEIGDDARHVRQVADRLEGRTALEVDEQERNPVGGYERASPVNHASRNSLLPLPVVPATSACGPCCTRSMTSGPSPAVPDRDRERRPR